VEKATVNTLDLTAYLDQVNWHGPTERTYATLAGLLGVPVGYFLFDGEQHGFRKAENIRRALDAELYFYAMLILRSGLRF
jgi:dipeptidyl aminopeptidase/acylaminoacyl peptidase